MPPVGANCPKIDDDGLANARPIEVRDFKRSCSDRWSRVTPDYARLLDILFSASLRSVPVTIPIGALPRLFASIFDYQPVYKVLVGERDPRRLDLLVRLGNQQSLRCV